jgi:hypothetical protein
VRYAEKTPNFKQNSPTALVDIAQAATEKIAYKHQRAKHQRAKHHQGVNFKLWSAVLAAAVLAGCASKRPAAPAPAPSAPAAAPAAASPGFAGLPQVGSWVEYRRRAAQLIMAANAGRTFTGKLQEPMFGIPSVTVSLNADGSVRSVDMLRSSKIAPSTNPMAVDAVRRVGNFGSVANLPRPWQFNETFLYNDAKLFQLDTIVSGR